MSLRDVQGTCHRTVCERQVGCLFSEFHVSSDFTMGAVHGFFRKVVWPYRFVAVVAMRVPNKCVRKQFTDFSLKMYFRRHYIATAIGSDFIEVY